MRGVIYLSDYTCTINFVLVEYDETYGKFSFDMFFYLQVHNKLE